MEVGNQALNLRGIERRLPLVNLTRTLLRSTLPAITFPLRSLRNLLKTLLNTLLKLFRIPKPQRIHRLHLDFIPMRDFRVDEIKTVLTLNLAPQL